MTNGEMFKSVFPDIDISEHITEIGKKTYRNGYDVTVYEKHDPVDAVFRVWFPHTWWDSEYKKEMSE